MKKIAFAAFVTAAALALSACGSSDSAKEEAAPDNVELPAEETMNNVDATATPVADASASADAMASDAAMASGAASDAAAAPAQKKM